MKDVTSSKNFAFKKLAKFKNLIEDEYTIDETEEELNWDSDSDLSEHIFKINEKVDY